MQFSNRKWWKYGQLYLAFTKQKQHFWCSMKCLLPNNQNIVATKHDRTHIRCNVMQYFFEILNQCSNMWLLF